MRGDDGPDTMFSCACAEQRVHADHPLRARRGPIDDVLDDMSHEFDGLYACDSRPGNSARAAAALAVASNFLLDSQRAKLRPAGDRPRRPTDVRSALHGRQYADRGVGEPETFSPSRSSRLSRRHVISETEPPLRHQPRLLPRTAFGPRVRRRRYMPTIVRSSLRLPHGGLETVRRGALALRFRPFIARSDPSRIRLCRWRIRLRSATPAVLKIDVTDVRRRSDSPRLVSTSCRPRLLRFICCTGSEFVSALALVGACNETARTALGTEVDATASEKLRNVEAQVPQVTKLGPAR